MPRPARQPAQELAEVDVFRRPQDAEDEPGAARGGDRHVEDHKRIDAPAHLGEEQRTTPARPPRSAGTKSASVA